MNKQNTYNKIVWTETAIRKELARLDAITGLHGASLPIRFSNAKKTLGMYSVSNGGSTFTFSNFFFQKPNWPAADALDVIRHEYAHYMDHKLYGNYGHGATWKHCCVVAGADPERLYNPERRARRAADNMRKLAQYDTYHAGTVVVHSRFGDGVIDKITGEGTGRTVSVAFRSVGRKTVPLAWLVQNCRRVYG